MNEDGIEPSKSTIMLENLLIVDVLLVPPGLLILYLVLAWRRWHWPWRVALLAPFTLAVYASMAIWTVVFGTNLRGYDGVIWYLLRIAAAYVVAVPLWVFDIVYVLGPRGRDWRKRR